MGVGTGGFRSMGSPGDAQPPIDTKSRKREKGKEKMILRLRIRASGRSRDSFPISIFNF